MSEKQDQEGGDGAAKNSKNSLSKVSISLTPTTRGIFTCFYCSSNISLMFYNHICTMSLLVFSEVLHLAQCCKTHSLVFHMFSFCICKLVECIFDEYHI